MTTLPTERATSLAAAIGAGVPVCALLGSADPSADVQAALDELAAAQIDVIRTGNSLAAPLSLERLVQQIAGDGLAEQHADGAARLLAAVITRSDLQRHLVVIVERAETLTDEALDALRGLTAMRDPTSARVQVALIGAETLAPRIADGRTHLLGHLQIPDPAAIRPEPTPAPPRRPRSDALVFAGLGVCAVAAVLFMIHAIQPDLTPTIPPPSAARSRDAQPALPAETQQTAETPQTAAATLPPAPVEPLSQATAPPPPEQSTEPPAALPQASPPVATFSPPDPSHTPEASSAERPIPEPPIPPSTPPPPVSSADAETATRARLYRDFTAFVGTSNLGKRMSPAARAALFEEYLARHQAALAPASIAVPIAAPAGAPIDALADADTARIPGEPHILIYYAADSDPDREIAEHQAELLRDRVAGLELQPETDIPAIPTIRYEFPADRPAALALARTTWAIGGDWQIDDLSATPKRPEPGTIEMWLPRR